MVRIAVLPIPEWHGVCPPAPILVYIALVMDSRRIIVNPALILTEDRHLVGVLVSLSFPQVCPPVMSRIL